MSWRFSYNNHVEVIDKIRDNIIKFRRIEVHHDYPRTVTNEAKKLATDALNKIREKYSDKYPDPRVRRR